MSDGAKTDRELSASSSFVEVEFGDKVGIVVQLKDADGANKAVGTDRTSAASVEVRYRLRRRWDSNPRTTCIVTSLAGKRLQPDSATSPRCQ